MNKKNNKLELTNWTYEALINLGGKAKLAEVAREIWENHESDLRSSGDQFYTWQYDMRWCAQKLRDDGYFMSNNKTERGYWEINREISN